MNETDDFPAILVIGSSCSFDNVAVSVGCMIPRNFNSNLITVKLLYRLDVENISDGSKKKYAFGNLGNGFCSVVNGSNSLDLVVIGFLCFKRIVDESNLGICGGGVNDY